MIALRIVQMDRTRETWIERMYRSNYLERLVVLRDRRPDQRFLIRLPVPFRVTRASVPRARNNELIVVDLPVLDPDPVCESTSRGFG
jgi:hypothetical protein